MRKLREGLSANLSFVSVDYNNMQEAAVSMGTAVVNPSGSGISNDQQQMPGLDTASNGDGVRENVFVSICGCEKVASNFWIV